MTGILPLELAPGLTAEERNEQAGYLAFTVFAHPAPITVACMFVLSAALERTGVVEALGNWFERAAASSPLKMLLVLMGMVAFLSAFVNNTPVVVVFMPIIIGICRRKDWKASRYLIPLSYAAIAGGTITIVGTSTNLVAAGTWQQHFPDEAFSMFQFAPLGFVFVVVAIVYMVSVGRHLLPDRVTLAALFDSERSREFITHAFVREGSPLVGRAFRDTRFAKMHKTRVLNVFRDGATVSPILDEVIFEPGDEIVLSGELEGLVSLGAEGKIELGGEQEFGVEGLRTESTVLMEGVIGPDSSLEGKNLKEVSFQQRFGVTILAIHRRGRSLRERFEDERLAFGDTLCSCRGLRSE
ncbi:MAG: SLC13 family permease [Akkermansiaceae bacterium]|nr:SLC13 family permease [Akkermansiaceae bacterium]